MKKISQFIKELKGLSRFTVRMLIIGILIMILAFAAFEYYNYNYLSMQYTVADDCSYVVSTLDKNQTFSPIEKLPESIDEEFGYTLWRGRLESDKSKTANCYEYEYEGLKYLKVEILENKLIVFGDGGTDDTAHYYVENK